MPMFAGGLQINQSLMVHQVSIDMHFEPSVGLLARRLDKLGLDIRSFREPLEQAVRHVIIPSIRKNFDYEGRPKWTALSGATIERRMIEGYGPGPILARSGNLRGVATQLSIWTIDREKALVTDIPSSAWYGKVHQAGATFSFSSGAGAGVKYLGRVVGGASGGQGKIPARPFLMIQDQDIPKIERVFDRWLGERIRAAGLS
jgi:phage gpG-like protein